MVCLFCDGGTAVANSRLQKRENNIWRRRKCKSCGTIFTTIEKADLSYSIRVVSDKDETDITPFFRSKLQISVYKCCKHLKDPEIVSDALTNTIVSRLTAEKSVLIRKKDISSVTYDVLHNYDKAAGTQYRAFHP